MMAPLRAVRSSSPMMAVTDMPGISTETGGGARRGESRPLNRACLYTDLRLALSRADVVWDPLGLSDNMDEANLRLIRAAELKHGRVAMVSR